MASKASQWHVTLHLKSTATVRRRWCFHTAWTTVRQHVELDEFVVMPNHLHGILVINEGPKKTSHRDVSTKTYLRSQSLGAIIGQFKSVCTKRIRGCGFSRFGWQARFYEHIIRDESSLGNIRQYIVDNPAKWELDDDNPKKFQKK